MKSRVISKRPFRVNFEDIEHTRSEDLVESQVLIAVLKKEVPKAIDKAIKERKTYATVFEINTFNVFVEIHKKDWVNALNSCIELHAKDEEYETCREISKTVEKINNKDYGRSKQVSRDTDRS